MNRCIQITVLTLAALAPLAAQTVPQGWKQRIDRSTSASDPDAAGNVKFVTQGGSFHADRRLRPHDVARNGGPYLPHQPPLIVRQQTSRRPRIS